MKIINVIQNFNVGGIQKLLLEYLRYFKNDKDIDYRVVVLEPSTNSNFDNICKNEGLKIHYLNGHRSKSKHYYIRQLVLWRSYDFALYRYLKREKPDIVHTHNTRILIRIQWCIKKLHNKYKWFHTLHSDPYAINDAHIATIKTVFNEYNVAPICLNETQFNKAQQRYGLTNCSYLYNSFDQNKFKSDVLPSRVFRRQLKIQDDAFIIGAVGRISDVKNYPFLINLIAEIKKQIPGVIAIVVGDKTDSALIERKVSDLNLTNNVMLVGARNDVANFYNIFDRFVLTSFSESSSLALIEAQCFDKICIVSDSIPKESICLNNRVIKIGLNEEINKWVSEIITPSSFECSCANINDYSIENVAKRMMNIYTNEK